ncbi:sigma-w pathway protein ysdB [Bacillus marinisedimentorum]|uniref:sigma-w pathway protein ysdB n=1 Tax=Bacillus marinisedimentorum TaxID=1821260 RepID=UPI000871B7F9|nr:sigma-w pathway protein ysdB [Bacillus marinisedimentorum]
MIIILFRLFILAAVILLIYSAFKYVLNPMRKLELAYEQKKFFLLDDQNNVRKNLLLTYKGVLFEGEKYLGTTEKAFEVVDVSMRVKQPDRLVGMDREDFYFIEKEILIRYPNAKIEWKSPVKEFLAMM